jgi:Uma2 family endonuclease
MKGPATIDDLLRTPKDGRKYELVDGEILVSPAGMLHAKVAAKVLHLIATYLESSPIGEVYSDGVGIQLPNGNVRSPDVTFVRFEKLPGGESPVGFGEVVPDLAVEILSPNDSVRQVATKIGEFLECGVSLVWIVDPERRTVVVYRSLTDTTTLIDTGTIDGGDVLPGFSAPVRRFFRGPGNSPDLGGRSEDLPEVRPER